MDSQWARFSQDKATSNEKTKARKGLNATSGVRPLVKEIVRSARAVFTGVALSLLKLPIRWPRRKYVIKKVKVEKWYHFCFSKCLLLRYFSSGSTKRANRPCT